MKGKAVSWNCDGGMPPPTGHSLKQKNFLMKVTGTGSLRYTEEILILPFPSVMILFVDKANCTPGTHYHTKGD